MLLLLQAGSNTIWHRPNVAEVVTILQTRMRRLEAVRLEVDSRRRTVVDLRNTIENKKAKPITAKLEFQVEQLIKKMQHKENKLASMYRYTDRLPKHVWAANCGLQGRLPGQRLLLQDLGIHGGFTTQNIKLCNCTLSSTQAIPA